MADTPQRQTKQVISISTGTVLKTVAILLVLAFLWLIRDIVIIVLFSLILASAIDPLVDRMQRFRIPRALSVLLFYLVIVVVVLGITTLLVPAFAQQAGDLVRELPDLFQGEHLTWVQDLQLLAQRFELTESARNFLTSVGQTLSESTGGVFATLSSFFAGAFSVAAIAVLTFYLTVEEKGIKKFFAFVVPSRHHTYVTDLTNRIQQRLGGWLRGYLSLGLIVAVLTYVGLLVVGVDYALVLALFAGLMEFVPLVGPILAAIPALFFAFTQNPVLAIFVLVLYFGIQQLENHVLVPKIMQRSAGLSPVVVILVILVGAKVAGFIGLLLAVPLTIALVEFGKDVFEEGGGLAKRFGRPS